MTPPPLSASVQLGNVGAVFLADPTRKVSLPFFETRIPAGFPSPADDYLDKKLDLNEYLIKHPVATFFVRITGDSMIGAHLFDLDILVVDRAMEVQDGHIVFARVNNEFCIKQLRRTEPMRLCSANEAYPNIIITPEMEFEVWGRVMWSITKH